MTSSTSSSPTTFVQADTNTFRDLVQKLTGLSGDSENPPINFPSKLSSKPFTPGDPTGPRRSLFKLQERRQTIRRLEIMKPCLRNSPSTHHSPHQFRNNLVESPAPSPVTPLATELLFFPRSGAESPLSPAVSEEEKGLAEKGFFIHSSPKSTPRGSEPPQLLSLFPLSSPSRENQES